MFHSLLCVLSLWLWLPTASTPPAPTLPVAESAPVVGHPPYLDEPDHWQVYDENGAMDLEIHAEFMGNNGVADVYYLTVTGTVNGQPFSSWSVAYDWDDGQTLRVYSNDSGRWMNWEWRGDHYDKVGGTPARRSYRPVY